MLASYDYRSLPVQAFWEMLPFWHPLHVVLPGNVACETTHGFRADKRLLCRRSRDHFTMIRSHSVAYLEYRRFGPFNRKPTPPPRIGHRVISV